MSLTRENTDIKIIGSGKLFIRDQVIEFENKVNSNFLVAPQYFLDQMGLSRNTYNLYTPDYSAASKFSVLAESVDSTMSRSYTDMGSIGISSFSLVQSSMLKSTLRASGVISKDGTIKSAGFNVATNLPTPIIPALNVPYRRNVISLTGSTTVSVLSNWVYNDSKKALYNYYGATIYKIPYDIDTGVIGVESVISTDWESETQSRFSFTDGRNRVFRQSSATTFKIFNMETESVTTVTLSEAIAQSQYGIAWDEPNNVIRCYNGTGFTIALDGTVTTGTNGRPWSSTVLFLIKDTHVITANSFMDHVYSATANIATFNMQITASNFIRNNRKEITIVDFPNTSPATMTQFMRREPDTSQTILTVPTTNVSIGETFGIEYSFTVVDGR